MKLTIFYFDQKVSGMFTKRNDSEERNSVVLSSAENFVYRDEIVAKVVDVDSPDDASLYVNEGYDYYKVEEYSSIKPGEGIYYDESSFEFKASEYGFAVFSRKTSQVMLLPVLKVSKDKTLAYLFIHPTKFKMIPKYSDIGEVLVKNKILSSLDENSIEEQLSKIDVNNRKIHQVTIASAKKPVNGYNEHFVPLIEFEKKAGTILDDGSIDFKDTSSIIEIKTGQKILEKIPELQSEDGYNIYGKKIEAVTEERKTYLVRENIAPLKDELVYVSLIDGRLNIYKNKVSVLPVAVIHGDVDYNSGNIDFNGSVEISGSVLPGFTVKAKGNITIEKSVDDTIIEADGDVIVMLGIGGQGKTRVTAGGDVKAKFILNSTIEAGGIIEVADSIINSKVYSNNKITVTDKHGKIIGGETMALYEIIANVSGVPNENKTVLTVGKSLLIERELQKIKIQCDILKTEVEEITEYINAIVGRGLLNNPKKFIANLEPVKQKLGMVLLSTLSGCNKEFKKVIEQYNEEEKSKYTLEREPKIIIFNKAYPGTVVNIKKQTKIIDEELQNVKLYEDTENNSIRFASAV